MAIKDLINTKKCVFICCGGSCMKKGAEEVTQNLRANIKEMELDDEYHTVRTKCMGRCDDGPVLMIAPDNIWLRNIQSKECQTLLKNIQTGVINQSKHFLYQIGDLFINSDSIPSKHRKKLKEQLI